MLNNFAILDLGTADMVIILAIILLLFGSKKLPELAKSLGSSARELKTGFTEASQAAGDLKRQVTEVTAVPQAAAADTSESVQLTTAAPVRQKPAEFAGPGARRIVQ